MDCKEYQTFGPPGTGKTEWIKLQIERALQRYMSNDILVASFTRASAHESAARITSIPDYNIGTMHSLCYRALDCPPIAESKAKEFNEAYPNYRVSLGGSVDVDDPNDTGTSGESPGDEAMNMYQVMRARMIPSKAWPTHVQVFAQKWEAWCADSGYTDFTGLIERCVDLKMPPPNETRIGFFDEAQDFTRLEFTLARMWGESMDKIVFAGDDDQSVYGFKGASPEAFIGHVIPQENKLYLRESYRLPSRVLNYSKRWIEQVRERENKPFFPKYEGGSVQTCDSSFKDCRRIADMAMEAAEKGKTSMILASCAYMLEPIKHMLLDEPYPFHNPYRVKRGDWNPMRKTRGKNTTAIQRLASYMLADGEGRDIFHPKAGSDPRWNSFPNWKADEFYRFMSALKVSELCKRGGVKALEAKPDCAYDFAREWFNERGWEFIDKFWKADHSMFEELIVSAKRKGFEFPLRLFKRHGYGLFSMEPRIVLGTIHSVKGGEADNVFILPDLSPQSMQVWAQSGDPLHDDILRQFYVGMTRAKENVYLCKQSSMYSVGWLPL